MWTWVQTRFERRGLSDQRCASRSRGPTWRYFAPSGTHRSTAHRSGQVAPYRHAAGTAACWSWSSGMSSVAKVSVPDRRLVSAGAKNHPSCMPNLGIGIGRIRGCAVGTYSVIVVPMTHHTAVPPDDRPGGRSCLTHRAEGHVQLRLWHRFAAVILHPVVVAWKKDRADARFDHRLGRARCLAGSIRPPRPPVEPLSTPLSWCPTFH